MTDVAADRARIEQEDGGRTLIDVLADTVAEHADQPAYSDPHQDRPVFRRQHQGRQERLVGQLDDEDRAEREHDGGQVHPRSVPSPSRCRGGGGPQG
jgi:hypothetical protein